jgi:hypothetical protein
MVQNMSARLPIQYGAQHERLSHGVVNRGAVITEAAGGPHPAVAHLVYLTAVVLDVNQSMAGLAPATVAGLHRAEKNPLVANVAVTRELSGWCWSLGHHVNRQP